MKTPRTIKVLETIVHVTGVSTIFRPAWNEYKASKEAIDRSERLLAEREAERRGRK